MIGDLVLLEMEAVDVVLAFELGRAFGGGGCDCKNDGQGHNCGLGDCTGEGIGCRLFGCGAESFGCWIFGRGGVGLGCWVNDRVGGV